MQHSKLKQYTQPFQDSIPEYFNIAHACTSPDLPDFNHEQTALVIDSQASAQESDTKKELSYRQLNQLSNQFAHHLLDLGLAKQDRVMLWLPNCMEFPIAFFGTLKANGIAVPCSMMLTGDEMAYLAKDSAAKILVTTKHLWQGFKALTPDLTVILVDDETNLNTRIEHESAQAHALSTKANDPAYLVYTSGTTGYPKGVLHAHRALIGRIPSAHYWFDYQESDTDRILHSGKFNWTYVLGTALMDPLFLGKTVVLYEGESSPEIWPKLIAKHNCTIFIGVPTIYRQIVQKTNFEKKDVPTLRHCMSAGEHLSDEMLAAWRTRFGQDIYEAVGMSECSYYLSQNPSQAIRPGSAGFPQPGHQIHLLDEAQQPVDDEQEGMLCIALDDPGLFLEYWQLPDTTSVSRQNGYFLTGDYARRDKDGYIWFLGRKDDIINSFGFRISPHEIERVIKTHNCIADCVALEKEIAQDKNIVVACVILKPDHSLDEATLIAFANEHLAKYKVPKQIVFMQDFPRTANGKVLRKQLKTLI